MLLNEKVGQHETVLEIIVCLLIFINECTGKEYFDLNPVSKSRSGNIEPFNRPPSNEDLKAMELFSNYKTGGSYLPDDNLESQSSKNKLPYDSFNYGSPKKKRYHHFLSSSAKPSKCKNSCDLRVEDFQNFLTGLEEYSMREYLDRNIHQASDPLYIDSFQVNKRNVNEKKLPTKEEIADELDSEIHFNPMSLIIDEPLANINGDSKLLSRYKKQSEDNKIKCCDDEKKCTPKCCQTPLKCTPPCCKPNYQPTCPEKVLTPCPCPCPVPCQPLKEPAKEISSLNIDGFKIDNTKAFLSRQKREKEGCCPPTCPPVSCPTSCSTCRPTCRSTCHSPCPPECCHLGSSTRCSWRPICDSCPTTCPCAPICCTTCCLTTCCGYFKPKPAREVKQQPSCSNITKEFNNYKGNAKLLCDKNEDRRKERDCPTCPCKPGCQATPAAPPGGGAGIKPGGAPGTCAPSTISTTTCKSGPLAFAHSSKINCKDISVIRYRKDCNKCCDSPCCPSCPPPCCPSCPPPCCPSCPPPCCPSCPPPCCPSCPPPCCPGCPPKCCPSCPPPKCCPTCCATTPYHSDKEWKKSQTPCILETKMFDVNNNLKENRSHIGSVVKEVIHQGGVDKSIVLSSKIFKKRDLGTKLKYELLSTSIVKRNINDSNNSPTSNNVNITEPINSHNRNCLHNTCLTSNPDETSSHQNCLNNEHHKTANSENIVEQFANNSTQQFLSNHEITPLRLSMSQLSSCGGVTPSCDSHEGGDAQQSNKSSNTCPSSIRTNQSNQSSTISPKGSKSSKGPKLYSDTVEMHDACSTNIRNNSLLRQSYYSSCILHDPRRASFGGITNNKCSSELTGVHTNYFNSETDVKSQYDKNFKNSENNLIPHKQCLSYCPDSFHRNVAKHANDITKIKRCGCPPAPPPCCPPVPPPCCPPAPPPCCPPAPPPCCPPAPPPCCPPATPCCPTTKPCTTKCTTTRCTKPPACSKSQSSLTTQSYTAYQASVLYSELKKNDFNNPHSEIGSRKRCAQCPKVTCTTCATTCPTTICCECQPSCPCKPSCPCCPSFLKQISPCNNENIKTGILKTNPLTRSVSKQKRNDSIQTNRIPLDDKRKECVNTSIPPTWSSSICSIPLNCPKKACSEKSSPSCMCSTQKSGCPSKSCLSDSTNNQQVQGHSNNKRYERLHPYPPLNSRSQSFNHPNSLSLNYPSSYSSQNIKPRKSTLSEFLQPNEALNYNIKFKRGGNTSTSSPICLLTKSQQSPFQCCPQSCSHQSSYLQPSYPQLCCRQPCCSKLCSPQEYHSPPCPHKSQRQISYVMCSTKTPLESNSETIRRNNIKNIKKSDSCGHSCNLKKEMFRVKKCGCNTIDNFGCSTPLNCGRNTPSKYGCNTPINFGFNTPASCQTSSKCKLSSNTLFCPSTVKFTDPPCGCCISQAGNKIIKFYNDKKIKTGNEGTDKCTLLAHTKHKRSYDSECLRSSLESIGDEAVPRCCCPTTCCPPTCCIPTCCPVTCCPVTCCPVTCCPVTCCPVTCCPKTCCPTTCCPTTCCPTTCCPTTCCPTTCPAKCPKSVCTTCCSKPTTPCCKKARSINSSKGASKYSKSCFRQSDDNNSYVKLEFPHINKLTKRDVCGPLATCCPTTPCICTPNMGPLTQISLTMNTPSNVKFPYKEVDTTENIPLMKEPAEMKVNKTSQENLISEIKRHPREPQQTSSGLALRVTKSCCSSCPPKPPCCPTRPPCCPKESCIPRNFFTTCNPCNRIKLNEVKHSRLVNVKKRGCCPPSCCPPTCCPPTCCPPTCCPPSCCGPNTSCRIRPCCKCTPSCCTKIPVKRSNLRNNDIKEPLYDPDSLGDGGYFVEEFSNKELVDTLKNRDTLIELFHTDNNCITKESLHER